MPKLNTIERINRRSIPNPLTGCWNWQGYLLRGYGTISIGNKPKQAHRVSYEAIVGPIPEGLTIDHLCRNRGCCNPDHLDLVTSGENSRRGYGVGGGKFWSGRSPCPQGHEYAGDNLISSKRATGWVHRECLICQRERGRKHDAKRRGKAFIESDELVKRP